MIRVAPPWFAWVMRRFGFDGWTSLWNVIYIVPEYLTDTGLIRHEMKHLEQMERDGKFMFMVKYTWLFLRFGYANHPYEIEARKAQYGQN